MKKVILSVVALVAISFGAHAQRFDLGVNIPVGLPSGDIADGLGLGIGGGVFAKYFVADNIAVGAEIDFLSFSGEEVDGEEGIGSTLMPLMVTGDYHVMPDEDFDFYGGLGIGYFMIGGDYGDALDELELSKGGLGIAPRVGINYLLADALRINFNVGYNLVFSGDTYSETFDPGFGLPPITVEVESPDFNYIAINLGVSYDLFD